MRTKSKSKNGPGPKISEEILPSENAPEISIQTMDDMPDFTLGSSINTEESPRSVTWEARVFDVINEGRAAAYQVIDGFLMEVFKDIHRILVEMDVTEEEIYTLTGPVSGVTRLTLASVSKCTSENLAEYVLGSIKPRLQSQLLDIPTLSRNAFRTSYPQAFKKWEAEEDRLLAQLYKEGISWYDISAKLQRNINAVKLRAEKLCLATNTGAKHYYKEE